MSATYDKLGKPMELMEWAEKFEDMEYRRIGFDKLKNAEVSTVWIGVDHRFGAAGPPLIFETMVFGGLMDQEQERYSTLAEAQAGHLAMVEKVKAAG